MCVILYNTSCSEIFNIILYRINDITDYFLVETCLGNGLKLIYGGQCTVNRNAFNYWIYQYIVHTQISQTIEQNIFYLYHRLFLQKFNEIMIT